MKEEIFDIVDSNDKVIGKATRQECHSNKKLMHRGVDIFIFNSKGQLLLQKRSMKKDLYPGVWASSASGHLDSGETYEEAAERELKEELGIKTKFAPLAKYKCILEKESEIDMLFIGRHDGPFSISREEIDEARFFGMSYIKEKMAAEPEMFSAGFRKAFRVYIGEDG